MTETRKRLKTMAELRAEVTELRAEVDVLRDHVDVVATNGRLQLQALEKRVDALTPVVIQLPENAGK